MRGIRLLLVCNSCPAPALCSVDRSKAVSPLTRLATLHDASALAGVALLLALYGTLAAWPLAAAAGAKVKGMCLLCYCWH